MTIKDGFKFGLGFNVAIGMFLYAEQVFIENNPRYIKPLKRIIKAMGVKSPSNPDDEEPTYKNKIGFTIE